MTSPQNIFRQIDSRVAELTALLPLKPEDQKRLDKKFRLEFNYNSNHMEGNTLTYGETELLLIFDKTSGDHEKREYDEMSGHDVALQMIEQEAKDLERPLTEQFIRLLNETILVRPFWGNAITEDGQPTRKQIIPGQYKTTLNSVRLQNGEMFDYPSPDETKIQMPELVAWYNENIKKEHPLLLAALFHYRFVRIHPFDDGNGRVARLLMNYILLRNKLPMVVIKSEEKKAYLNALNKADTGDTEAFVNYIGEQLLWSIHLNIKAAKGETIDEPDDLDKKIAVLEKKIKSNVLIKRKFDADIISDLFKESLYSFIEKIELNINKFLKFYEHVRWAFEWDSFNRHNDFPYFKQQLRQRLEVDLLSIDFIKIEFYFKGFKADITSDFRLFGIIEILFEDYYYIIKYENSIEKKYSYDFVLDNKEIDIIINQILSLIYEDTELKINQIHNNN